MRARLIGVPVADLTGGSNAMSTLHVRWMRRTAQRLPLLLIAATLAACETIKSLEEHGLAASAFHGAYCEADEDMRERVEMMLVFDNGSPKLDIHCEPHRGPQGLDGHPPRLQ